MIASDEIVDTLEQSVADGCDAHDAEDRVVDELRGRGAVVTRVVGEAEEPVAHDRDPVQQVVDAAATVGRKVSLVGRSMRKNSLCGCGPLRPT